jgi:hypothetical protein
MSRREFTRTIDLMVRTWGPRVNEAALAFEARWTRRALRNHSAKLADAFELALTQFDTAMSSGSSTDIENAGTRLCRAYAVISSELQAAGVPDDAYMIGRDYPADNSRSKSEIIIAATPAAGKRARELHRFAKCFTPDEIAMIIALDERAKKIAAVKAAFPGAEITGVTVKGGDDADDD